MIDNEDIQKYLEAIKKSKTDNNPPSKGAADVLPQNNRQDGITQYKSKSLTHVSIDQSCDIRGIERMAFGKNVVIQKDCWLNIAYNNPAPGPMIAIDDGTNIGRRCTLSAANKISIGKFVLIAPNVFIADTHHRYQRLEIPIMHQGITTHDDQVTIGDETWIGINAVIMGNVKVGKHCVIGANSVVNKDIPDYCVAAGNPAKILKMYDAQTGQWLRVKKSGNLDKCPADQKTRLSEDAVKN